MADYFTQFSCTLDVGSTDNAETAIALYQTLLGDLDDGAGFIVSADDILNPAELWICDEGGHGEPENVVSFVKACAKVLGLRGCWGFQWSNTCSRPVLNAFAGGAVMMNIATGETIDALHTDAWLATRLNDAGDTDSTRSH